MVYIYFVCILHVIGREVELRTLFVHISSVFTCGR